MTIDEARHEASRHRWPMFIGQKLNGGVRDYYASSVRPDNVFGDRYIEFVGNTLAAAKVKP